MSGPTPLARCGADLGVVDVVWVSSEEEMTAMIASEPGRFFATAHNDGTPFLLVRLEAVDVMEASELVTESWRMRASRTLVKSWDAAH